MVTIKELSKQLGVSVSTVSKALNDSDEISEHTKLRVKELAEIHGYVPNKSARSLRSQSIGVYGVIVPNITNAFFAKALNGIEKEAAKQGLNIITCISNESLKKEIESLKLLRNGSVDGFILAVAEESQLKNSANHYNSIINNGMPVVMFDRVMNTVACDKVIIDDVEATRTATEIIIRQKRKNLAFLSTISNLNVGQLREKGFTKAVVACAEDVQHYILNIDSSTNIQKSIRSFLSDHPQIDGIIAADNVCGTTAIALCEHLRKHVPSQVSVIGFADETISELSVPRLSYIDQHAEEMGRKALVLLSNRLKHRKEKFVTQIIPTTLEGNQSI